MLAIELTFWISLGWLLYVYFGYPLFLWMIGLSRLRFSNTGANYTPTVSVLISARNEEKDIEWKIKQTLGWDYPPDRLQVLVASDASEDRTDEIVRSIIDPRLIFVRMERRGGKNAALNQLASMATGEILLFTDANSQISTSSLKTLAGHFADPQVGCVTGWEETIDDDSVVLGNGSKASLGYESWLNSLESRLGSVLVCDGSIFCIRKELFRQLRPDLANDLELPLWIGHGGYKLLYEPAARSTEKSTPSAFEEFQRRRRICGQGILGMWKLRYFLHGLRAWQFASRKLLRWLTLVPLVLMLFSSILLAGTWLFRAIVVSEIIFYVTAVVGLLLALRGGKAPRVVSLPFYFLLLNGAALVGITEACLGRRFAVWDIPSLSRGHEQAT